MGKAAERLGQIARYAFERQFRMRPAVCLACTELHLAFPKQRMIATFEHDGVLYINTAAAHVEAAFEFAMKE